MCVRILICVCGDFDGFSDDRGGSGGVGDSSTGYLECFEVLCRR